MKMDQQRSSVLSFAFSYNIVSAQHTASHWLLRVFFYCCLVFAIHTILHTHIHKTHLAARHIFFHLYTILWQHCTRKAITTYYSIRATRSTSTYNIALKRGAKTWHLHHDDTTTINQQPPLGKQEPAGLAFSAFASFARSTTKRRDSGFRWRNTTRVFTQYKYI